MKLEKSAVFGAADIFEHAKANLANLFTNFVTDISQPISERLMVWECHARDALPVGDWRSDCPELLEKAFLHDREPRRYQVVLLEDLAEALIDDELWERYYGDSEDEGMSPEACIEKICHDYPEIAEKFEAVFASEVSGFTNDW